MKHFFPNMWQDDLNQLILSTVQNEFLPTIETANYIIHHYNDLSSIPKFRIQLNQLLNMKWKTVVLSHVEGQQHLTTESAKENFTLCDYVMQSVPNTALNSPPKSSRRKGFDRLCDQYISSCLDNDMGFISNKDGWMNSSSEPSLQIIEGFNNEIKSQPKIESDASASRNL